MPSDIVVRRVGETVTAVRVKAESHEAAMKRLWGSINATKDPTLWSFYLHSNFSDAGDGWWEGRRRV